MWTSHFQRLVQDHTSTFKGTFPLSSPSAPLQKIVQGYFLTQHHSHCNILFPHQGILTIGLMPKVGLGGVKLECRAPGSDICQNDGYSPGGVEYCPGQGLGCWVLGCPDRAQSLSLSLPGRGDATAGGSRGPNLRNLGPNALA